MSHAVNPLRKLRRTLDVLPPLAAGIGRGVMVRMAAAGLALLLAGCGAGSGAREAAAPGLQPGGGLVDAVAPAPPDVSGARPAQAPGGAAGGGLPAPAQLAGRLADARAGSFTVGEGMQNGSAFAPGLPHARAEANGAACNFDPDFGPGASGLAGAAYAVWSFNLPDADDNAVLKLTWGAAPAAADVYVGLSHWGSGSWQWYGSLSGNAISFATLAPFVNAQDDLALALVVLGGDAASLSKIEFIPTQLPTAQLTADPLSGARPLSVDFDASASSDPDGTVENFEWDFDGDGLFGEGDNGEDGQTGAAMPQDILYANNGVFEAAVRVTDDKGASATASATISVNDPPTVSLDANPQAGLRPLNVNFSASPADSDGAVESIVWDFNGDGTFDQSPEEQAASGDATPPTYTYQAKGTFTARVRVTDDLGASAEDSALINVESQPGVDLSANPLTGPKPLAVTFTADASDLGGSITQIEWDFDGDGAYGEAGAEAAAQDDPGPQHTYTQTGTFAAQVRVTNDDDNTAEDGVSITAQNVKPIAVLSASPQTGPKPLAVTLDAGGSHDDDGGSVVNYHWDFNDNQIYNEPGGELNHEGDSSVVYPFGISGAFRMRVRVFDNDGASNTANKLITVTNDAPVADLQVAGGVTDGDAPFLVGFDASGSFDDSGDEDIANYEWDFDGDGTFNEAGAEADAEGLTAPADVSYNAPGLYNPVLRVTDSEGAFSTDSLQITVHGWVIVPVDDPVGSDVGYWGDITLINGNPAMAYRDGTAGKVRYAYSSTPTGGQPGDWTVATLDSTGVAVPGREISIAEVSGAPAISYCDTDATGNLIYQRATTATGASASDWPAPLILYAPDDTGYNSQLLMVNGNPAIAFDNATSGDLLYMRATTSTGALQAHWPAPIAIDNTPNNSNGCSLAIVNGNPAVAHYWFDGGGMSTHMRYSRSSTVNGDAPANWSTKVTVHMDSSPISISLGVVAGNPAILYQNTASGDVHLARSTGIDGAAWSAPIIVHADMFGNYASLAIVNGQPAAAYHDNNGNNDLIYTRATSGDGGLAGDWTAHETVDGAAGLNCGRYSTLVVLAGGQPAIYYRSDSASAAMYAVKY